MLSIKSTDAKEHLADLLNRVQQKNERIIITRRDKEIAALVPYADVLQLLALQHQRDLENAMDVMKEARAGNTTTLTHFLKKPTASLLPYEVKLTATAAAQLQALEAKAQKALITLLEALAVHPRPPGTHKINGMTGLSYIALEEGRVIYKIAEQDVLILLIE